MRTHFVTSDPAKSEAFRALVDRCLEARRQFDKHEIDYLVFIHSVEQRDRDTWQAVCGSFDEYLRDFVKRPDSSRYRNFKNCLESPVIGLKRLRAVGVDMCVEELKVASSQPDKLKPLQRASDAWVQEWGGIHPGRRYSGELRRKVAPAEVIPLPIRRQEELEALRAALAQMTRERNEYKRECERLRRENEMLLAQTAVGARKRPRPGSASQPHRDL